MWIALKTRKSSLHLVPLLFSEEQIDPWPAPCDHEEADTRLLIHLQDALQNKCTNCLVRTFDTDVVVILIGKFHHLITILPRCEHLGCLLGPARTLHIIALMLSAKA